MKVKIIKCSGKNYWYKDRIGETFDVTEAYDGYSKFIVLNADGGPTIYGIDKCDCEIVKIKNKEKQMGLKVGNVVTVIDGSTVEKRKYVGKSGQIISIFNYGAGDVAKVQFSNGDTGLWYTKYLKDAITKKVETPKAKSIATMKINKCSENFLWYKDKIGKTVDITDKIESFYVTTDGSYVNVKDVTKVTETPKVQEPGIDVPNGIISFYGHSKGIMVDKDVVFYYSKTHKRMFVSIAEDTKPKKYRLVKVKRDEKLADGNIYFHNTTKLSVHIPGNYMIYAGGRAYWYTSKGIIESGTLLNSFDNLLKVVESK